MIEIGCRSLPGFSAASALSAMVVACLNHFAVASAQDAAQEALMLALAKTNPAAAFWVLGEAGQADDSPVWDGPSDAAIAAMIARRDPTGIGSEPDLPIRAGLWLREAEQALLSGAGPLGPVISRHRDGQLVQWGVWLQNGYLTLARAHRQTPPPQVVGLEEIHPQIGRSGWASWEQFKFPVNDWAGGNVPKRGCKRSCCARSSGGR